MFPWTSTVTLGLVVLLVYVTPFLLPGFVVIFSSLTTVGALLYARQRKKVRFLERVQPNMQFITLFYVIVCFQFVRLIHYTAQLQSNLNFITHQISSQ